MYRPSHEALQFDCGAAHFPRAEPRRCAAASRRATATCPVANMGRHENATNIGESDHGSTVPSDATRNKIPVCFYSHLPQLARAVAELVSRPTRVRQLLPPLCQGAVEAPALGGQPPMFLLHKVQLLFDMGQHLHGRTNAALEADEGFVTLLDFLVVRLILDFQLLKVNKVQTAGQHLAGRPGLLNLAQGGTHARVPPALLSQALLIGLELLIHRRELVWAETQAALPADTLVCDARPLLGEILFRFGHLFLALLLKLFQLSDLVQRIRVGGSSYFYKSEKDKEHASGNGGGKKCFSGHRRRFSPTCSA